MFRVAWKPQRYLPFARGTPREKDMQHNRGPTLSPGVRGGSRPAARDQEKKIANAIQAGESKAQRP